MVTLRKWQHLFGTYDTFGRNVYLDSFDSDYPGGQGTWMRVNSWLTHKSTGAWCYGISPHNGLTGAGTEYRLTTMGPGVLPDMSVTVPSPGAYNAAVDATQNAKIAAPHDTLCKPN